MRKLLVTAALFGLVVSGIALADSTNSGLFPELRCVRVNCRADAGPSRLPPLGTAPLNGRDGVYIRNGHNQFPIFVGPVGLTRDAGSTMIPAGGSLSIDLGNKTNVSIPDSGSFLFCISETGEQLATDGGNTEFCEVRK